MKDFSVKRLLAVTKLQAIEQMRSYQLLIMNIIIPLMFYTISLFLIRKSDMNSEELSLLINSQFFSTSLMIGVITYSFTLPLINLVEIKERGTLRWIEQTQLESNEYAFGSKLSSLLFLNLHSIFVITLYYTLGYFNLSSAVKILVLVNLTFLVLNPLATIISTKIKSIAFVNNFGSLVMLLLVFSLTFSTLFAVQLHLDIESIQKFLLINPLFGYYDSMLVLVGNANSYFWGSLAKTMMYLVGFSMLTTLAEWKLYRYK